MSDDQEITMPDDERIAQMTARARRLWPGMRRLVVGPSTVAVELIAMEGRAVPLHIHHARALDAAEAALLALEGEPPYSHEREWRAAEQQLDDAAAKP
jgi:hypothetical protein